jgi:hypothetical protein
MKKLNLLIAITLLVTFINSDLKSQIVNIPDSIFKAYLVGNNAINTNGDTEIQVLEAQPFTGAIEVGNLGINTLTGIEVFTSLTTLDCNGNNLTSLDVSSNTALTRLKCCCNQISSLDVSLNIALIELNCQANQLTSLDVSSNTLLEELVFFYNQISILDVSSNIHLEVLQCHGNQLSVLDVSSNTQLEDLRCSGNDLSTLDVSNNPLIRNLSCSGNNLTGLDVSNNPSLGYLSCAYNLLTSLDLSLNSSLYALYCENNQLTSLNVKNGNNVNCQYTIQFNTTHTFRALGNPDLSCIEVNNIAYSNVNWSNKVDSTASFSLDCNTSLTTISDELMDIDIYPNPTVKNLRIDLGKSYKNANIEVRNLMGEVVLIRDYEFIEQVTLELKAASGIYFFRVRTEEGEVTLKVVKE